jgi:hypothetical protein
MQSARLPREAADPVGGDSPLMAGRDRLPGRNWECLRCGNEFTLKGDPKAVPRLWWIPPNNTGKSAWACPDCGNWSQTVPTE